MISDLSSIENNLRGIRKHMEDGNIGFAKERIDELLQSLSETPLSLIMINTQAVRALEQATEQKIETEREKLALEFQQRFEERLKANGLS